MLDNIDKGLRKSLYLKGGSEYKCDLGEKIGGGQGEVFKGLLTRRIGCGDRREVAVKIYPSRVEEVVGIDVVGEGSLVEKEAEIMNKLSRNPSFVRVFGWMPVGEDIGLIMEYIGYPTVKRANEMGSLEMDEIVLVTEKVAQALEYAHQRKIPVFDVKPANIFYNPQDGTVKLTDFGLTAAAHIQKLRGDNGMSIGTLCYMSPEFLEVDLFTQEYGKFLEMAYRGDVWGLGVTIYEMLTGRNPFKGDTPFRTIENIKGKDPPSVGVYRKDLNSGVVQVFDIFFRKALAKKPEERFEQAIELALELRGIWERFFKGN